LHEVSLAREIAAKVTREAEKANATSVVAIELEIGDLAFFNNAAMEMWIRQALEGSIGQSAAITIDTAASSLTCRNCGFQGPPEAPEYHDHHLPLPPLPCPRCGSGDVSLDVKRDCILKRIELEV
jgi:hydrogenase nickel insertion protein HypA